MKPAFPEIYSAILIEYNQKKNWITFRAFNSFSHTRTIVGQCEPRSVKSDSGRTRMAFDAKKLLAAMSKLNDQIFVHFDFDALKVIVKSKRSKLNDICSEGDDFIEFPDIESQMSEVPVPEFIKLGIERLSFIPDPKSFSDIARGIFVGAVDNEFCLIATDMQTLAISRDNENISIDKGSGGVVIPMQSVDIISSMLSVKKQTFASAITGNQVAFATKRDMIVSTVLEAKMPPYKMLLSTFYQNDLVEMKVGRNELLLAIEFVGNYADASFMQLLFEGSDNELLLAAGEMSSGGHLGEGSYKGEISVKYSSNKPDHFEGLIHIPKIVKTLKAIDTEQIRILIPVSNPRQLMVVPDGKKVSTSYIIALMSPDEVVQEEPEEEEFDASEFAN